MTIANGYATLAEAKARLWSPDAAPYTSDDSAIEAMIEAASRKIDSDCQRRFYSTVDDEVRTFAPEWSDSLIVWDILSITTLKTDEDGDGVFEVTWAATDFDLYPLNADKDGRPFHEIRPSQAGENRFPRDEKPTVEITGKFGYSASATVTEARTFTAAADTFVFVDNLNTLATGGLKTDDDDNGSFETTWTLTTDFVVQPVTGTGTTWLVAAGAKTFPSQDDGVQVTGAWGAIGAPSNIKEACLTLILIENLARNAFGGMGTQNTSLVDMKAHYQDMIAPFVRMI